MTVIISIDYSTEILMSGYADDYVLFAASLVELNKKLKALYDYCELNNLSC